MGSRYFLLWIRIDRNRLTVSNLVRLLRWLWWGILSTTSDIKEGRRLVHNSKIKFQLLSKLHASLTFTSHWAFLNKKCVILKTVLGRLRSPQVCAFMCLALADVDYILYVSLYVSTYTQTNHSGDDIYFPAASFFIYRISYMRVCIWKLYVLHTGCSFENFPL